MKANYLLLKNIEVSGIQVSDYRKRRPEMIRACFEEVFDLYKKGKIKPPPATVYPLASYGKALTDLLDRKIVGRAVLHP
jgi:NADPH2:quinone reductase